VLPARERNPTKTSPDDLGMLFDIFQLRSGD
jgi:hypothetical protein